MRSDKSTPPTTISKENKVFSPLLRGEVERSEGEGIGMVMEGLF